MQIGLLNVKDMFVLSDGCLGFFTVEKDGPADSGLIVALVPIPPGEGNRDKAETTAGIIARCLTPGGGVEVV